MTATHDLFVGLVAILLGGALLAGAAFDAAILMRLAKPQMLADRFGRPAARAMIAACGLALLILGGLIASGWRINW